MQFWRIFLLYTVTRKLWYSWVEGSCMSYSHCFHEVGTHRVCRVTKTNTANFMYRLCPKHGNYFVCRISDFFFPGMFARLQCLYWTRLRSSFLCILTVILPVVLHGYEAWSFALREEQGLRVFDSGVLRKNLDLIGSGKICPYATLATSNPTLTGVGFVVDRIAMLHVFLRILGVYPVIIIQPVPSTRI